MLPLKPRPAILLALLLAACGEPFLPDAPDENETLDGPIEGCRDWSSSGLARHAACVANTEMAVAWFRKTDDGMKEQIQATFRRVKKKPRAPPISPCWNTLSSPTSFVPMRPSLPMNWPRRC